MNRTHAIAYGTWAALVLLAAVALISTGNPAWLIAFTAALCAPWIVALVAL
jgi:hypothetical protein